MLQDKRSRMGRWTAVALAVLALAPGLLIVLTPGPAVAQDPGLDASAREVTVFPDPSYLTVEGASREWTVYADPDTATSPGESISREVSVYSDPYYAWTDADSREITVYPDTLFGGVWDVSSREYAVWYHETEAGVKEPADAPKEFTLKPATPNPFTRSTLLTFGLPSATTVSLELYDATGRKVGGVLRGSKMAAGWHSVRIDGSRLGAGVYFCRLRAGTVTRKEKLVIRE